MLTYTNVWIHVAVNRDGIREKSPFRWRCRLPHTGEVILLLGCKFSGMADDDNMLLETKLGIEPGGFAGWYAHYGDVSIEEHVARIVFKTVPR